MGENNKNQAELRKLNTANNFRSLIPIEPEDFSKLATLDQRYMYAVKKIESGDTDHITNGMIILGGLDGYKDSMELIQKAALKIQEIDKKAKEEAAEKAELDRKERKSKFRNFLIGTAALLAIGAVLGRGYLIGDNNKKSDGNGTDVAKITEAQTEKNPTITEVPTNEQTSEVIETATDEATEATINGYAVSDVITFGKYEQDGGINNGKEAINWIVLTVDDKNNRILLISEMGLDAKAYHEFGGNVTWEDCTLRKWLNEDNDGFYQTAFTDEETEKIKKSVVWNEGNPEYETDGGKFTQDKVFLLSYAEADEYFKSNESRQCKATEYTVKQGASVDSANEFSWWWLRTPGRWEYSATGVQSVGSLDAYGLSVVYVLRVVRPTMWLEI